MPKISSPIITTMKRPLHLLFPLLLLVASVTTLSCRVAIRRPITVFGNGVEPKHPKCSEPNSTLLKMAAIDIGEEKAKQEIEHLLEGSYGNHGRHRSISSWRRENHNPDDHVTFHLRATSTRGFPVPAYLRSPKYFNNWPEFRRVLRNWFRRKRYQPEIMLELIDQVKYPIDQFNGLSTKGPYSSCAVIGNSGILLKSDQGELIDSHEVVIRLNNARTKGFERNVGAKTSISFVNSNILHLCGRREGCFCHPYGEKVPIVMYICQAAHFMDYTVCNSSHKAPLLVTDARLDVLSARIVKYYSLKRFVEETGKNVEEWAAAHDGSQFHYSSGMQAVMLALGVCGRVSIFGFGKSALVRHHYHTNQKAELHLHDYEAEYAFYHDLVTNPQVIPFIADKFKIPPVVIYQ